eukprot:jgi/Mesen1/9215/ME000591S08541
MDLVVQLVPEQTCFVALPQSLLALLSQDGLPDVPLILELRARPARGKGRDQGRPAAEPGQAGAQTRTARWHLAWMGAAARGGALEVPAKLAERMGLTDGTRVKVRLRKAQEVAQAERVMMEPASEDDWEMLQLNQAHLEDSILSQVAVLEEGQLLPIWVRSQACLTLRVLSCTPSPLVRLGPGSDLVIAPKERKKQEPKGTGGSNSQAGGRAGAAGPTQQSDAAGPSEQGHMAPDTDAPLVWLRVQGLERGLWKSFAAGPLKCQVAPSCCVFVSPATAASAGLKAGQLFCISSNPCPPEASAQARPSSLHHRVPPAGRRDVAAQAAPGQLGAGARQAAGGERSEGGAGGREERGAGGGHPPWLAVQLRIFEGVHKGHVMLAPTLCLEIGARLFSRVCLQACSAPAAAAAVAGRAVGEVYLSPLVAVTEQQLAPGGSMLGLMKEIESVGSAQLAADGARRVGGGGTGAASSGKMGGGSRTKSSGGALDGHVALLAGANSVPSLSAASCRPLGSSSVGAGGHRVSGAALLLLEWARACLGPAEEEEEEAAPELPANLSQKGKLNMAGAGAHVQSAAGAPYACGCARGGCECEHGGGGGGGGSGGGGGGEGCAGSARCAERGGETPSATCHCGAGAGGGDGRGAGRGGGGQADARKGSGGEVGGVGPAVGDRWETEEGLACTSGDARGQARGTRQLDMPVAQGTVLDFRIRSSPSSSSFSSSSLSSTSAGTAARGAASSSSAAGGSAKVRAVKFVLTFGSQAGATENLDGEEKIVEQGSGPAQQEIARSPPLPPASYASLAGLVHAVTAGTCRVQLAPPQFAPRSQLSDPLRHRISSFPAPPSSSPPTPLGESPNLESLSWLKAPAEQALARLRCQLSRETCPTAAHDSLSAGAAHPLPPRGGGILLHGPQASGKTRLALAIALELGKPATCHAHGVHVRCGDLAGEPPQEVRAALLEAVREAVRCAPAVIVFDDLDALLPAPADGEPGGVNPTAGALVEHFCDLIDSCQQRHGLVALLATARAHDALPPQLLAACRFDFHVELPAPAEAERAAILMHAVEARGLRCSQALASRIAARCQGYDPSDIEVLVDRAVHSAAARLLTPPHPPHPSSSNLPAEAPSTASCSEALSRASSASRARGAAAASSASDGSGQPRATPQREGAAGKARRRPESGGATAELSEGDFGDAQDGFVPAGMRGVAKAASAGDGRAPRSWADLGGLAETRAALQEILELPSRFPGVFARAPLRLRSGVLLYGPPGCGKTHIVGVAAAACGGGMRCISVKGPELLDKYIGASEQAVRAVFARAARAAPCVLFFDEFDAIAPKRGHDSTGVTDRVVNQLLTELDGVEGLSGVFVIAATSRPDLIDAALLRPGRLDRLLLCDFPSCQERCEILRALSRSLPLAADVDLDRVAHLTDGFTGADLQALLSDAQLASIHAVLDEEERRVKRATDGSDARAPPAAGAAEHAATAGLPLSSPSSSAPGGSSSAREGVSSGESERAGSSSATVQGATHEREGEVGEGAGRGTGGASGGAEGPAKRKKNAKKARPTIGMADLQTAIAGARLSVSDAERARLNDIYDAFLTSRTSVGTSSREAKGKRSTLA